MSQQRNGPPPRCVAIAEHDDDDAHAAMHAALDAALLAPGSSLAGRQQRYAPSAKSKHGALVRDGRYPPAQVAASPSEFGAQQSLPAELHK